MTISINRKACTRNKISVAEVFLLLLYNEDADFNETIKSLVDKGYITASLNTERKSEWRCTRKGIDILHSVILDSDKHKEPMERLESLAAELKSIFPKGKKDGTNFYWAEGSALIIKRLQLFFKKYGNTYTDEQIINAAEKYVQSFNGQYQYMQLLKYFIFKDKIGVGGHVEECSELVNYIDNAGQEDGLKNDWTSTLK